MADKKNDNNQEGLNNVTPEQGLSRGKISREAALEFHIGGKVGMCATKPLTTQTDLSLAYSPGVAEPCLVIAEKPEAIYDYTSRGNYVAVISNGTAVLGLGNLGAAASKPVMEGKCCLFKRFAGIDAVDIEVDTTDPEEFINAIKLLGPSWGGINLEDIKAPDCFIIEDRLKELMDIPVFHDDQHGTAIIALAGFINACHLTNRNLSEVKLVINGAGAAAIACADLIKKMGVPRNNVILCDRSGVVYAGRKENMNKWKEAHAVETKARTLADALAGADAFMGLSAKGAVSKEMVESMNSQPIIFAMANPDPEITPEDIKSVRSDAIIATGRSDYPNQVNNVMGFPYIFRGALDVRATTINDQMKIAAAEALAQLARAPVPDEVKSAYSGRHMVYGKDYIIPVPFDPRLISTVPVAVAKAAIETGVAKKPISDFRDYRHKLTALMDPTANTMSFVLATVHENPKKVVFAEGEEESIIRAACVWHESGYGTPILVGREQRIKEQMAAMGMSLPEGIEILNASVSQNVDKYIKFFYEKNQRNGYLHRDATRLVKNDRNIFSACMLAMGDADVMVTGVTRNYRQALEEITSVIKPLEGSEVFTISLLVKGGRSLFIADTMVNEMPSPEQMANIAVQTADKVRKMGHYPRVALLSFANFGNHHYSVKVERVREAVRILDKMKVDFEYDGEMTADVALNPDLMRLYPFCRLSGPANVLIMPALHSANIASKMLQQIGGGTTIDPILVGLSKPVQILRIGASVSEIVNLTSLAAIDLIDKSIQAQ